MKIKKITVLTAIILIFAMMLTGCGDNGKAENESKVFPEFTAADFDGNEVSSEVFSDNAVTVMTFWFTGCSACISEMPQLEILNEELKERDAALFGVCTDVTSLDGSLNLAKNILEQKNATYTNIVLNSSEKVNPFIREIYAYPTLMLVNRKGEIVGEPIVGAIMSREEIDEVIGMIDEIIEADEA